MIDEGVLMSHSIRKPHPPRIGQLFHVPTKPPEVPESWHHTWRGNAYAASLIAALLCGTAGAIYSFLHLIAR